jgi:hypothetical protein
MNTREIEHMWKVASNNPNHDTNWHDPIVVAFAKLVAQHEREACAKLRDTLYPFDLHNRSEMLGVMNQGLDDYQNLIRARGQA